MALVRLSRRLVPSIIFRSHRAAVAPFSSGTPGHTQAKLHAQIIYFTGLEHIRITFVTPEDEEIHVSGAIGSTVLEVAHANKIEIEGACGGECACSTCHVIVDEDSFEKLPELELEEEDMLDLAAEVSDTSVTLLLSLVTTTHLHLLSTGQDYAAK